MKKKVLSMFLAVSMAAGMLIGCGSTGTQSAADQLEAEGVEEIPVAETQTEEAEASAEASEIDL